METQNYINHIALVLDASTSMMPRANDLIRVADDQIKYLAVRSQELDQETRVSVYLFADDVRCVIYDKDVLRLPSIRQFYRANGMTALIDATLKSQDDLAATAQLYGDHAFLTYVLTDGRENASRSRTSYELASRLQNLRDNWTVAVLVPDQTSKFEAKRFGFPADNIAIWDVHSSQGIFEAGATIRRATDQFMVNRAQGIRGSRSMFSTGSDAVNRQTIRQAGLKTLSHQNYQLIPVSYESPIREFVEGTGHRFITGTCYYQLNKTETIQPQKQIAVYEKATGKVYVGAQARQLVGLGNDTVRVRPQFNPEFDIFVQSTSVNRKLVPGTKLLILQ
jgi:hypothetical protein